MSGKPQFGFMKLAFKVRDLLYSRTKVLRETGMKAGDVVLDFGCGTGSYLLPAFSIIGETGRYIAIDSNQEAIDNIKKLAEANGIRQIEGIRSNLLTGLKKRSVDVVLLYDVFHMVENQTGLLAELSRVLKETGELSFSDHHMKKEEILKLVTSTAFFAFKKQGKKTFTFVKRSQEV